MLPVDRWDLLGREGIHGLHSPNDLHSCLPPYVSFSELERHLPFQPIQASCHERTIIAIPHCIFPSTLDDSCSPRRDVGVTGEISEGWVPSTEPQTLNDQNRRMGQESLGQA